ncbi:MAG: hypothetical protein AUI16_08245 [Alphaproteobacteria bacterium 13_2_20CM_2_64_7]|nr:MAG: hypothetical protein AUI16_08245 [Alphaproteobacteria bacterium 13_2_20CM_2_64_7]
MICARFRRRARLRPVARLQVEVGPFRGQRFANARAGQQHEPEQIGHALILICIERGMQPGQFVWLQVAFTLLLRLGIDADARILGDDFFFDPEIEDRSACGQHPVCLVWRARADLAV